MAIDLGMGVDTNVTPSLHPQVVASLEEFTEETRGHLEQVVQSFLFAYEGIARVHSGREAIKSDPTLTEAAQVLRVADAADKVFKDAAAKFDKATANMQGGIKMLVAELTTPVVSRASHVISTEIRAHVKALGGAKGVDFVRAAIERGDADSVSAVLGAPSYLSGITPEAQSVLLRMWNEKSNPAAAKRLRAMEKALELLSNNAPKLHVELQKAIGVPPHEVQQYRAAKARTDKAFSI
jgi:hypothetical protein